MPRIGVNVMLNETVFWPIDGRGRMVIGHEVISPDARRQGALPRLNTVQWEAIVRLMAPAAKPGSRVEFYRVGGHGAFRRIWKAPITRIPAPWKF